MDIDIQQKPGFEHVLSLQITDPKTTALGGVATGKQKAQLAASG